MASQALQKHLFPSEVQGFLQAHNEEIARLRTELADRERSYRQLLRQHNNLLTSICGREVDTADLRRSAARAAALREQACQLEARCAELEAERLEALELCDQVARSLEAEHQRRLQLDEENKVLEEHVQHLEAMVELLSKQLELIKRARKAG